MSRKEKEQPPAGKPTATVTCLDGTVVTMWGGFEFEGRTQTRILGGAMRRADELHWSLNDSDDTIHMQGLYRGRYGQFKAREADVLAALDKIGTREAAEIRRARAA